MKNQTLKAKFKKQIAESFEIINPHLYTVEERILAQARSFDPAVEGYVAYACESRGKRIRPAMALLAGGATGEIGAGHVDLAIILELIHIATLVHDDIIDGAELRRNQPTANAKWGNSTSVLLGDVLFAHALKLSTGFHNSEVSRKIAQAASDVCSGEIIQTQRRFDLKLGLADYYRIIEMKTAALFGAASELGAFLSDAEPEVIAAMKQYGLKIGTAYQIYDDLLDIAGDEESAGKTLGSDLRKGKLTLPVLSVLKNASADLREELHSLIVDGSEEDSQQIVAIIEREGGITQSIAVGLKMIEQGCGGLDQLPPSKSKDSLRNIGGFLSELIRSFETD